MPIVHREVQKTTIVVVGIDTHEDTHHVGGIDVSGPHLADRRFPVSTAGFRRLLHRVSQFGLIDRIGVELTGSYGAGLTPFLRGAGITELEVDTTDKATRARCGKDDRTDVCAAADTVLAGMATAELCKTPDGFGVTKRAKKTTFRPDRSRLTELGQAIKVALKS